MILKPLKRFFASVPKEKTLVAPFTQVTQGNKCPHGLPVGACPICSGMGGGGARKNKDVPRNPGEMTYSECMAAWIKIQAAKDAKIQARIDKLEQAQAQQLLNRVMTGVDKIQKSFNEFMQKLENLPTLIKTPIQTIAKIIIAPVLNLISKLPVAINNIQMFFSNITKMIISVSEKIAMVLGEIKNFINAKVSDNIKKTLKTILTLFSQSEEEEKEDEETQKIKAREIKKVLKGLFRIRRKEEEKEEDEYQSA